MKQYKDIHLANSIQALNLIAQNKACRASNFKKPEKLMDIAKKIYVASQKDPFDEEMTYVLLFRFIQVYDQLIIAYNDQVFVSAMLGKEIRNAKAHLNDLKNNLINRYEENQAKKIAEALPAIKSSVSILHESNIVPSFFKSALFISCQELFKAVSNKEVNMLVLDARSGLDFANSSIKGVTCISIPDSCIQSGLSAHKLGATLPSTSLEKWEKRDSYDILVLLDWCTCETNFTLSKLEKLRTILVDWDYNRNYTEKPVVLRGGYSEWLEMYPTFCTNPNVKYVNANVDLDDLLNLDVIEYPTDEESKSHEIFRQEIAKAVTEVNNNPIQSRTEILEEEKALITKNNEIEKELLDNELKWKDVQEQINKEDDVNKLQVLNVKKQEVEDTISKLSEQEDVILTKKSKLADHFNLSVSFKPGEMEHENTSQKLEDINKLHEQHLDLYQARQAFVADRQRLLDEARLLKKPRMEIKPDELKRPSKPTINRSIKPKNDIAKVVSHMDGVIQSIKNGLTGLQNIKNTCYMNSIIQCLRHVPEIIEFYCNGNYSKHISRTPPVISNEFAHLVRTLWSNSYSVIRPTEFYKKISTLSPAYKAGYHEDCMEFFLQLFNYLSDDCALDINSKNDWNETQMAWYKQHGGKISVYIDMFYHQIRVQRSCKECCINSLKFEIDNVFYLPIPESTFSLEQCMQSYLSSTEKFTCKKCKIPNSVKKNFAHHPPVLVISLKRHMQDFIENSTVHYKKNQSLCNFPVDNFRVGKFSYKLRAVALHVGTMQSGHYTAACLNPTNNRWYLFNDEEVSTVDIDDTSIKMKAYAFFYSVKREMHAG